MENSNAGRVKFFSGENIPLEMHRVRMVQKLNLWPVDYRLQAIEKAGFNSFLLASSDVYMDMLTDSGTNAMSDRQMAAMLEADDAYAGSRSFTRMEEAIRRVFGKTMVLPVHQGRAAEHILGTALVKKGDVVPMNYHFTTTKAHIELPGGKVLEIFTDEALKIKSSCPFKGNMDLEKLQAVIRQYGVDHIPYIRMEASTNLIGGQPFSMENFKAVRKIADQYHIDIVLDASLIGENAYLIKQREEGYQDTPIKDILLEMCSLADIVYFSSRKVSSTRGGAITTNRKDLYMRMRDLVPLFEGFLTYGGMSVREIEAMAVGLDETTEESVINQSPSFVEYLARTLDAKGIPVVLPAGALGCHVDAKGFLSHLPQSEYPAGALVAAFYIISGCRGMERGTISTDRDENGNDVLADMELMRLAFPRRVFTLSQTLFVADRLEWLYANRKLVGGLRFQEEPKVLRFFVGRLEPIGDWPQKLAEKFLADLGSQF